MILHVEVLLELLEEVRHMGDITTEFEIAHSVVVRLCHHFKEQRWVAGVTEQAVFAV